MFNNAGVMLLAPLQEMDSVRVTLLSPGVTETELGHDISDPDPSVLFFDRTGLREWIF